MAFPNIIQCAARKLHCTSFWMVAMYNNELTRICNEHNMFHRLDKILRLCDFFPDDDFLLLMNSLDDEMKEYMLHAETYCSKFMMGHIEWSQSIRIRLSPRWLLHRVQLWMIGARSCNPCNMFWDCFWMCIPNTHTSTYGAICTQIIVCGNEIARLSNDTPALRCQHLLDLIALAKENKDDNRAKAITEILKREVRIL